MVNINLLEDERIFCKVNASCGECSGGLLYLTNKRVGYMNDASEETYNISLKDIQDFYIGDSEDEESTINIIEFGKAEALPEIFIVDRDDVNNFCDLLDCAVTVYGNLNNKTTYEEKNNNQDGDNKKDYKENYQTDIENNYTNTSKVTSINIPIIFIVCFLLGIAILVFYKYNGDLFGNNDNKQDETIIIREKTGEQILTDAGYVVVQDAGDYVMCMGGDSAEMRCGCKRCSWIGSPEVVILHVARH